VTTTPRRWACTETVDEQHAVIRVHGTVGSLGADLLRGTIEALRLRGHRAITLVLTEATSVADDASAVLTEVADNLAGAGARLIITDRTTRTAREEAGST
jgi:hypothetical protein